MGEIGVICHRTWAIGLLLAVGLAGCTKSGSNDLIPSRTATPTEPIHYSRALAPPILSLPPARSAGLSAPVLIRRLPPAPRAAGAPRREEGAISLNFDKASLRSVIDAVLGDALGVPYTVDERVDGVVTLISPQKLTRDEALDVLDGVLKANGATLIKGDDLYRVVLVANARQGLPGPRLGTDQPGFAISVYVARHTAAASLQRLIEPLYQIPGALQADPDHNLLLISGSAEERRALSEAARLFDQDWLANQSVGIFPLHHAKPKGFAEELRGVLSPGGTAAGVAPAPGVVPAQSTLRITPIERLNAVMVVTLQPEELDLAAEWVARLDQAGAGERQLHVYAVRYANAAPLARTLSRLFGGGGTETGSSALPSGTAGTRLGSANVAPPPSAATGVLPAGMGGNSGSANGFGSADHPLTPEGGADQADSADGGGGANGPRIIADSPTHSLMILANDGEFATIQEALEKLDAKPAQILIEATIAEVALNKELQFGVQYYLRGAHLAGSRTTGSVGFSTANSAVPLGETAPGFNGVIGTLSNPSVILNALNAVTDSRVLSSPQLLVSDSREAVLKVGTQTPLLTQQLNSNLVANSTLNSVEYHDTGIILRVLPRANDGDVVSLDIAQEVSAVVPTTTATLTPSITLRRIESSVTVQSGQTVMLGGLISENNALTRDAIPGLGDIPLLGELFGNRNDTRDRTELVVFITPHVLRDEEQAERLTRELMGRMQELSLPLDKAK